jgi:hypothetical protein
MAINRDQCVSNRRQTSLAESKPLQAQKTGFLPLIAKYKTILHKRDRSTFHIEQSGQWRSMTEQSQLGCFD